MKDLIYLLFHLLTTLAKLIRPGGSRTVIAENLLLKQQLIIHSRSRLRAPNLSTQDRSLLGFWSLFLSPKRIVRAAILIKSSSLLRFHSALKKRKYRLLYSPRGGRKPGPKGPCKEVVDAIVAMKQRNPRFGCPRIAQQISLAFGLDLDKDTVRRALAVHYKLDPNSRGLSWLTTIGHAKDSLWSRNAGPVDLFRCESILLKSHWVMVVMDQYTRRIIGFGVHAGNVDGPALPHVPMSHPFVERLIGSVRRELLDQTFFWTETDLENMLRNYQSYFNESRTHSERDGVTPMASEGNRVVDINGYRWKKHCRGLFELPVAA